MVYNGTTHQACGGTVSRSRNNADTRQPSSPVSRWQCLEAPRQPGQYPVNTKFMPTRFEPGNGNLWKIGPASIAQHGSAQDLQHTPGRTVHSRCLHHLPARSQHSSQHRWPRPRQRLRRTPIAQRQIRKHNSQQYDLARQPQTDLTAYFDFYSYERPHPPKCTSFSRFVVQTLGPTT